MGPIRKQMLQCIISGRLSGRVSSRCSAAISRPAQAAWAGRQAAALACGDGLETARAISVIRSAGEMGLATTPFMPRAI